MFSTLHWTFRTLKSSRSGNTVCGLFPLVAVSVSAHDGETSKLVQRKRHDPIWLENRRARNRQLENEKLARDPDYRETRHRTNQYAEGDYKARFHLQRMLYDWCKRKFGSAVPWKTHTRSSILTASNLLHWLRSREGWPGSKLFWLARDSGHRLCNGYILQEKVGLMLHACRL